MVSGIAESGEQALKFIKENHVDILVTDVRIGGSQVLNYVQRQRK